MKKASVFFGLVFVVAGLLFFFRTSVLQAISHVLICEDVAARSEVVFVLSGGAYDRSKEAFKLYRKRLTERFICTGGNLSKDYQSQGVDVYESDLSVRALIREGVPLKNIGVVHYGSSTEEEIRWISGWMKKNVKARITIVCSDFHSRRVRQTVNRLLAESASRVNVIGAAYTQFDQERWWESEHGLIAVNNEYVKLIYYKLKY